MSAPFFFSSYRSLTLFFLAVLVRPLFLLYGAWDTTDTLFSDRLRSSYSIGRYQTCQCHLILSDSRLNYCAAETTGLPSNRLEYHLACIRICFTIFSNLERCKMQKSKPTLFVFYVFTRRNGRLSHADGWLAIRQEAVCE